MVASYAVWRNSSHDARLVEPFERLEASTVLSRMLAQTATKHVLRVNALVRVDDEKPSASQECGKHT